MGLDVDAYYGLTKRDHLFDANGEPVDRKTGEDLEGDWVMFYTTHGFPNREGSIVGNVAYSYTDSDDVLSMGYGRFNVWREKLAEIAGWPLSSYNQYGRDWPSHAASAWDVTEGPLWELIFFSDCEGVLGPETCKKLAADFDAITGDTSELEPTFSKFKAAVNRAANENGALKFH